MVVKETKELLIIDKDLVSFFDLLAKFDFEDKQKEKLQSDLKTGPLTSTPKEPVLSSDNKKHYGVETKAKK